MNTDEGDPSAFFDRFLLEDDPLHLVEVTTIVVHTVDARRDYIYIRKKYPDAVRVMPHALEQTCVTGWLGPTLELELVMGQGAYIRGKETSPPNALEGRRPEVRPRPPQTNKRGLSGAPTLAHGVRALYAIPWIVTHGAAAYATFDFSDSRGIKSLSLNSLFYRPGLYEVEFGINLVDTVEQFGQGLRRGKLNSLAVDGLLADIVPPTLLDTRLGYGEIQAIDCAVGHGDVITFVDDTSIPRIVAQVLCFGIRESCGKCVPCYFGVPILAAMTDVVADRLPVDTDRFRRLTDTLAATSLYGHGRGLAEFIQSVCHRRPSEL